MGKKRGNDSHEPEGVEMETIHPESETIDGESDAESREPVEVAGDVKLDSNYPADTKSEIDVEPGDVSLDDSREVLIEGNRHILDDPFADDDNHSRVSTSQSDDLLAADDDKHSWVSTSQIDDLFLADDDKHSWVSTSQSDDPFAADDDKHSRVSTSQIDDPFTADDDKHSRVSTSQSDDPFAANDDKHSTVSTSQTMGRSTTQEELLRKKRSLDAEVLLEESQAPDTVEILSPCVQRTRAFRDEMRDLPLLKVVGTDSAAAIHVKVRGTGAYDEEEDTFVLYAYRNKPEGRVTSIESVEAFQCEFPPAIQLTSDEQKKLRSEEGLKVFSPTGQAISFRQSRTTFEAVLKKEETPLGENEEISRLKNALSLITMINNVREKCKEVHVETADPFLAHIANAYIDYLAKEQHIVMQGSTVSKLAASTELKKEAQKVFEKHFLSALPTLATESSQRQWLAAIDAQESQQRPHLLR